MTYHGGFSERLSAAHWQWVQEQYAVRRFLASGPLTEGGGGVALAVAPDRAGVDALLATDPVVAEGAGRYEVMEVQVSMAVPELDWLRAP